MDNKLITINNNYFSIDIFKLICSYLVITIHCTPFMVFGNTINLALVSTVSRIAVPFFFACSGFLFFKNLEYNNEKIKNCESNRKKLFKYVGRVVLLYIIWSAIYLVIQIPEWYSTGWLSLNAFIDYFISCFRSSSYYHLWYLLDLVYAILFAYLIMSLLKRKIIYILALVLYLLGILVYSYYFFSIDILAPLQSVSNFFPALWDSVTRAFPLIIIGVFSIYSNKIKNNTTNLLLFIISFIFLHVEFYFINTFSENHEKFSYIVFTIPCIYFFFSWVINQNIKLKQNISKCFRNISTIIYCVHPLFIYLFSLNADFINLNSLLKYIIIALTSTLVAYTIVKISKYKLFMFLKFLY